MKKQGWKWLGIIATLIGYANCLPAPLFEAPYSTVLEDRNGQLLGANIAADGQWRFPPMDSVPAAFSQAIIIFEDKRFYAHPGVDPLAMARAIRLNVQQGEIVSGGSTLSMQVIRLAKGNPPRTFWQKLMEVIQATRLELRYSKNEILALYASHAPFGGNVVGLEAAAWKYFGRRPDQLSSAEAATLAVLPNAPGLIHPGRNRDALQHKRDRLLNQMKEAGHLSQEHYELALLEALPLKPKSLPMEAPHLLERLKKTSRRGEGRFRSTLEADLQQATNAVVSRQYARLKENGIHNQGVLVVRIATGEVVAYVGNTPGPQTKHGHAVDMIPAKRSTGSILKPLLYAEMLEAGEILPHTLMPDVPTYFGSYHPTNFDKTYQGAVPAHKALSRSLNVPTVWMLREHGITRFAEELRGLGLTTLTRPSEEYGLSLILGGAEASLWDLTGVYASMGRLLLDYQPNNGRYAPTPFSPPILDPTKALVSLPYAERKETLTDHSPLGAAAVWHTLRAMEEVSRPEAEGNWEQFASAGRIAWKTGTSYGYRDAWSVGLNGEYAVGVWVGNADGEGRPGLIGGPIAAPIMFEVFDFLGSSGIWFESPWDDQVQLPICRESGHIAAPHCPEQDSAWLPQHGTQTELCPYHKAIWIDPTSGLRANSDCMAPFDMTQEVVFQLPPRQEAYYRMYHPTYASPPAWRPDCQPGDSRTALALVYPRPQTKLYLPVELDGQGGELVMEAIHQDKTQRVFWHMDEQY
ncbi:MAG: penicillin-binding protein 1C, partial [Bacteroidota bacterium]